MDELIPKNRQMKSSTKEDIPNKENKKHFMDGHLGAAATLLPPWRTQPSIYESSIRYPSPYVCNRNPSIFSPRSYYIVFSVPDEHGVWDDDDGKEWAHSKWYTIKIHTECPDKVCPKPLIPFWQGKIPEGGGLGALGSDIYCLGGIRYTSSSAEGIRNVYKLRVTPRAAKEWVSVPPMICRRNCPQASALGRKMYVRNSFHYDDQPCCHWGEVFDPANGKWEAVPNPPNYPSDYPDHIIICEAVENPDRIIVAYRVKDDRSSAIFYVYNVQHRNWGMLAPSKRKLHRFCDRGLREDCSLKRAVSANNTLYWIRHPDKWMDRTDEILLIAYDLNLDVWLEGHVKGIKNLFSQNYKPGYDSDGDRGGPILPIFRHLEKQRFCLLQRDVGKNDYLHCVVVDVSHMTEEKTLEISIAWDQKYSMEPCRRYFGTMLRYCDILPK